MNTLLNEIFQGGFDNEFDQETSTVPKPVKMKNANAMVDIWDITVQGSPRKIDIDSREFTSNYIDNFVRYQVMTPDSTDNNYFFRIYFANGKEKKFNVNDVPVVYNPPRAPGYTTVRILVAPDGFLRDKNGLIFPLRNGKVYYSTSRRFTPKLAAVRMLVDMRRQAMKVMEVGAAFAKIISSVSGLSGINTKTGGPYHIKKK